MAWGLTLTLSEHMYTYAGIGYSLEEGQLKHRGTQYNTVDSNDGINGTFGLGYLHNNFGGSIGYDTASEAMSFSILLKK